MRGALSRRRHVRMDPRRIKRPLERVGCSHWTVADEGKAMLQRFGIGNQPNVMIVADPGPRTGSKIKSFAGLPVSWIPTTWVFKGGDLRYALNYGEVRFDMLQQMLADSTNEWSHQGEAKLE